MGRIRLTLCVDDSHADDLGDIAGAARRAGMTVEQELSGIGVLTGSIDADNLDALRAIAGVTSVEQERDVTLPPPGSPVQ